MARALPEEVSGNSENLEARAIQQKTPKWSGKKGGNSFQ